MRISPIRFAAAIVALAVLLLGAGAASAEAPGECINVNGEYGPWCGDSSRTHQNNPWQPILLSQAEVDALTRLYVPPVVVAPPAPPVEVPSGVPTEAPSEAPVVDGDPASFDVGGLDAGFADPGAVSSF